jgi:hypothetical protein
MTKAQMTKIFSDFGVSDFTTILPMTQYSALVVSKEELLISDYTKYRYKYDLDNMIVSRYLVKPFSSNLDKAKLTYPASPAKYDVMQDASTGLYTVYQYYCDSNGDYITDEYDIGMITEVVPNQKTIVSEVTI